MSTILEFLRKHGFFGFRQPLELLLIGVAALLNITLWAGAGLLVQSHGQIAPLHYTIYFGIDLTAAANRLYALPALGTIIWLSHLFASRAVKHDAWRQAWLIIGLAFQLILAIILAALAYLSFNS